MRQCLMVVAVSILFTFPVCGQDTGKPHAPTIHLFFSPTCPHCHPVRALIKKLQAEHPGLQSVEHNLADPNNVEVMASYYQRYHVPENQWGGTIALFVGDRWWNDGDKILKELGPVVHALVADPQRWAEPQPLPVAVASSVASESVQAGSASLRRVFSGFGVAGVAVAGLLDGINPCALATLVFLISYLNYVKRSPAEVLLAGLLFGCGVFLTYLGIGLGFLKGLEMTQGISMLSKLLYPVMAAGTLVLAGLSLRDYGRARRGAYREMTLKLPQSLSRMSHGVIRGFARVPLFLLFAFVGGVVVSVLELFCTGQIYLPTLMYMWSTAALRGRVFGLLLLYAGMFTLPIIVLAGMVYGGVSSQRLAKFAQKNTAVVKLATAALFLALSVYLIVVSISYV